MPRATLSAVQRARLLAHPVESTVTITAAPSDRAGVNTGPSPGLLNQPVRFVKVQTATAAAAAIPKIRSLRFHEPPMMPIQTIPDISAITATQTAGTTGWARKSLKLIAA